MKVHLGVDAGFRPATKAHPAFIVDDVRSMAAAVVAAGFAVDDDEPLDGFDRVYVSDPFGNRIELMQPTRGWISACHPVPLLIACPKLPLRGCSVRFTGVMCALLDGVCARAGGRVVR